MEVLRCGNRMYPFYLVRYHRIVDRPYGVDVISQPCIAFGSGYGLAR